MKCTTGLLWYSCSKKERKKGMFYLTTHATHFIFGYMGVGHIVKDHNDNERRNPLPPLYYWLLLPNKQQGICYMHFSIHMTVHSTVFGIPDGGTGWSGKCLSVTLVDCISTALFFSIHIHTWTWGMVLRWLISWNELLCNITYCSVPIIQLGAEFAPVFFYCVENKNM